MDNLPYLRQENTQQNTKRYGAEKIPSYCPKCKQETLINVEDMQIIRTLQLRDSPKQHL